MSSGLITLSMVLSITPEMIMKIAHSVDPWR
jgi:hypothetical protein